MASENFLEKILEHKRKQLKAKEVVLAEYKKKTAEVELNRYGLFKKAISAPGAINLIAEIKKASPSQGLICKDFDVARLAKAYVDEGAAAISVLTEEKFFLGKLEYIRKVSDHFSVPVLTKDFIIDELQIYEAFSFGASAVLLIVAILSDDQLRRLIKVAAEFDMDALVEVHDEAELNRALNCGAEIIGINNRDLRTFKVDLHVAQKLIPKIPEDKIIVVESGLKSHPEIQRFYELGAHAVLIGETFLRAPDVRAKVRELMKGERI